MAKSREFASVCLPKRTGDIQVRHPNAADLEVTTVAVSTRVESWSAEFTRRITGVAIPINDRIGAINDRNFPLN
jgi:hypothetical protein